MEFEIVEAEGGRFAEGRPGVLLVKEEGDALDLLAEAGQRGVRRILLHAENLSPDFFELTTGLAGAVFQKFSNYSIRAALLVDPRKIRSRRFRELLFTSRSRATFTGSVRSMNTVSSCDSSWLACSKVV